MKHIITLFSLFCATSLNLHAGDWTGFRGNNGTAVSDEKNLPASWDETKNIRWKVSLPGRGLSSPVIAAGRLYLTACSGYKQNRLHVLCFDAAKGKKLWERTFTSTGNTGCHPKTCMAANTPVTDGKRVFALFATGDLTALDKDGNLLWYRSLVEDYPKISNQVGMASSPVLHNNVLLLPMENADDSFLAGVDATTGKNIWKIKQPKLINWITPIIHTRGGQVEAIFQNGGQLTALNPMTGKVLWELKESLSSVACPLAGEGLLFVSGRPYLAIKPAGKGKKPEIVWKSNKLSTGYSSPLYHDGKIYGLTSQVVRCADAKNGEELWRARATGPYSASPVLADGKLYAPSEKGIVHVFDITGEKPKQLAQNDMKDTLLATPAIADGAIYLRSDKTLWCISSKK